MDTFRDSSLDAVRRFAAVHIILGRKSGNWRHASALINLFERKPYAFLS